MATNATAQRCFTKQALSGPPLIQNGRLILQTHDIGWIVTGGFTFVATVVSFWLIGKHLMWYTKGRQQRYIVRLLLMVPIYAIVSLASYIFWNHAIPITLVRDSYESFVLYSFFYLLLQYLAPTTEGQKEVFRNVVLKKWIFPLGSVKYRPRDGLYFLQLMKWGVLQYCVVRPTTTLVAVILDFIGLYCADSWSPGWGHIYITIIVSVSVTIAMYCLFQLYIPIAKHLAPHKPLLKFFSVKAVVFLTFWQATGLSALSMFGVVKDTTYMTADDINTGIAAIIETFEMMCFAVLHIRAFSYKPYCPNGQDPSDRTRRLRSLMHALDIRDMWQEIRDGSVYMGKTIRGAEVDEEARRRIHFSKVMGREREFTEAKRDVRESWPIEESFYDHDLLLDGHRNGAGSEAEARRKQRKRELGGEYEALYVAPLDDAIDRCHTREMRSWWRSIYDRLSQGVPVPDREREERLPPIPRRPSQKYRRPPDRLSRVPSLDSPPPPPTVTFEYSSLGNGHSSVRPSSFHGQEQSPKQPPDLLVDPSHLYHNGIHDRALPSQLIAPRPTSNSQSCHVKPQVSSAEQTKSSAISHKDNDRRLLKSSVVTRSDSLLARIFPKTSSTFDGHASVGGRSDTHSSQTNHSSPFAYPISLPQTPVEQVLVPRPRGPQKRSSPVRGRPRPRIVLPEPLAPALYPATELPRHIPEQPRHPVSDHTPRAPRSAGGRDRNSGNLLELPTLTDARLGRVNQVQSGRHDAARNHSNMPLPSLPTETQAMSPIFTPVSDLNAPANTQTYASPRSTMTGDTNLPLAQDGSTSPSTKETTLRISTTSRNSPSCPQQLRHPRGDIGSAKRPWS